MTERKIVTIIILVLSNFVCFAQLSNTVNNHFIICIDGAMPHYDTILVDNRTKEELDNVLARLGKTHDDYFSIVSYELDITNPDTDRFALLQQGRGDEPLLWKGISKWDQCGSWTYIAKDQHRSGVPSSFQSGAKPFCLCACQTITGVAANHTYLIMLTDEKVNGIDDNYVNEWRNLYTSLNSNTYLFDRREESFFSVIKDINWNYRIGLLPVSGRITIDGSFVLAIYSVTPSVTPSLQSVTDIPTVLPISRTPGGYKFSMAFNEINKNYSVNKLELTLSKGNKKFTEETDLLKSVYWSISKQDLEEGDTITLRAWVKFNDGSYNGVMMNPYDSLYANALTISQIVTVSEDSKLFGKFPFPDSMWSFSEDDIHRAILIWEIIICVVILIIFAIIVVILYYRLTAYKPSNDKIKIRVVD